MEKFLSRCLFPGFLSVLLLLTSIGAAAQASTGANDPTKRSSMIRLFAQMPLVLVPQIDSAIRENLIRAYELESREVSASSTLRGKVFLRKVTANSLELSTSKVSTITLHRLEVKDGEPRLMIIRTVDSPVKDSNITFFTSDWHPLASNQILDLPQAKDFVPPSRIDPYAEQAVASLLQPLYLSAEISESLDLLTFAIHLSASMEDREQYRPDMASVEAIRIRYSWSPASGRWIRQQ